VFGEKTGRTLLAAIGIAGALLSPATVFGAKGGGTTTVDPSLNLSWVSYDGFSKFGAGTLQPRFQATVGFAATYASTLKNPRVWVSCTQDGSMVYGEGGSPSSSFKLGGDMSQWVMNGGGAANCTADLYWIMNAKGTGEWNGRGAQGGNVYLAHTQFDAAQ